MLPQALLGASFRVVGEQILPHYLGAQDEPWLRALLEECRRFVGRKQTELLERLREPRLTRAPKTKFRIATHVLGPLCRERSASPVPPKEARAAVFRESSRNSAPRQELLSGVAASLGVDAAALEASLFADLHSERRVAELPEHVSCARLALAANLAIVTSLLRRAARVRITVRGNARALVRHARRVGLICTISRLSAAEGFVLDVSGPFALFRHTDVYGRALASLLPRLASGTAFELSAECALGRGAELATLVVRSGDPIGTGRELVDRERQLEARFERAFRRAAPDWDVSAEPPPVQAGDSMIFPDFELVHRGDPTRRWLVEIVGFWTPASVRDKLERLRNAGIERVLLCVDQKRCCAEPEPSLAAHVVPYQSRLDPRAVLAIIDARSNS